jgi:hypothetical protein
MGGQRRLEERRMMVGSIKQSLRHEGEKERLRGRVKQSTNQCHATSRKKKDLKNSWDFLNENVPNSLNSIILIRFHI